jgi:hypothetical protein
VAVLLTSLPPSQTVSLIDFSTPNASEIGLFLIDQALLHLEYPEAVEADVDIETRLVHAAFGLCFIPASPATVFLRVYEIAPAHYFEGVVVCSTRDEAAQRAGIWFMQFPQRQVDIEAGRQKVVKELQSNDETVVQCDKLNFCGLCFEILTINP